MVPLLAAILLAGCFAPAGLEVAYENVDWLIGKELERRLCPAGPRRVEWEQAIDRLHRWHRRKELPRYAGLLRRVAAVLDRAPTKADLDKLAREVERAATRLRRQVVEPVSRLLASREDRELECLERSTGEALKAAREAARADVTGAEQAASLVSRLEPFTGAFDAAQRARITAHYASQAGPSAAELDRRGRAGAAFIELLRRPVGERLTALREILDGSRRLVDDAPRPATAAGPAASLASGTSLVWQLLQLLRPEQRQALAETARDLATRLERLSRRRSG